MFVDFRSTKVLFLMVLSNSIYLTLTMIANVIVEEVMITIVGITKPNSKIHDMYGVLLVSECQSGVQL